MAEKENIVTVHNSKQLEDEKLVQISKGFRVIMETDTKTVMERKRRRSWFWILVFWPMLFIKKTDLLTINLVSTD